jgi:starch phosphorylase
MFTLFVSVPADCLANEYTSRMVVEHCHANIPAEEAHIKWYR